MKEKSYFVTKNLQSEEICTIQSALHLWYVTFQCNSTFVKIGIKISNVYGNWSVTQLHKFCEGLWQWLICHSNIMSGRSRENRCSCQHPRSKHHTLLWLANFIFVHLTRHKNESKYNAIKTVQ
jgi:hypothetical protein